MFTYTCAHTHTNTNTHEQSISLWLLVSVDTGGCHFFFFTAWEVNPWHPFALPSPVLTHAPRPPAPPPLTVLALYFINYTILSSEGAWLELGHLWGCFWTYTQSSLWMVGMPFWSFCRVMEIQDEQELWWGWGCLTGLGGLDWDGLSGFVWRQRWDIYWPWTLISGAQSATLLPIIPTQLFR